MIGAISFRELCVRVRAYIGRSVRGEHTGSPKRSPGADRSGTPGWVRDRDGVENHPFEDIFFQGPKIGHGYIMRWRKCRLIFVCCGHYEKDRVTLVEDMYLHAVGLINRKGRRIRGAVPPAIHAIRFPMVVIFGEEMDLERLHPAEADAVREILACITEVRQLASLPCS